MSIKFTDEQLRAIEESGDLLVSASAGSGKTTVMLERVWRKIASGALLSRMLIATYTDAAAGDMRSKLNRLLREKCAAGNEFAMSQIAALPTADISTLHSFCMRLARKYFYVTGDDPSFEIVSTSDSRAWRKESIERAVSELITEPDVRAVIDTYKSGRSLYTVYGTISRLIDFSNAQDGGSEWIDNAASHYGESLAGEIISARQSYLKQSGKAGASEELTELTSEIASIRNDEAKKAAEVFIKLAKRSEELYREKKDERGQLDFNDLELRAKAILESSYGDSVRADYDYIFIDEYQDINPLQEKLIKLLKRQAGNTRGSDLRDYDGVFQQSENEMFYVGDIKQSIYGFRNCSTDAFVSKTAELPPNKVIRLNSNFRSCTGILDFCDDVFSRAMTEEFGRVDYVGTSAFNAGRHSGKINSTTFDGVEIVNYEKVSGTLPTSRFESVYSVKNAAESECKRDIEAETVASKIVELLQSEITDDGVTRQVTYDDIVVISRDRDGCLNALCGLLSALGIPHVMPREVSLTEAHYNRKLLSMMKLVNNRCDDIAMLDAMRSYFGGFTDSELAEMRLKMPNQKYFYECVGAAGSGISAVSYALKNKARKFLADLDELTALAHSLTVGQLAGRITARCDYFKYILGTRGGATHAEQLSDLLDNLSGFSGDLSEWFEYVYNVSVSAKVPPASGAVRIITAHSAKGLEFPCVILCNLGESFKYKRKDLGEGMCDKNLGLAMKSRCLETRTAHPSDVYLAAKIQKNRLNKEEELRILYVAMTRAKYKLTVIMPPVKNLDKSGEEANNFAEWIAPHLHKWGCVQLSDAAATVSLPSAPPPDFDEAEKIRNAIRLLAPKPPSRLKIAVTALSKYAPLDESEPDEMPVIGQDGDRSSAERGNAYHEALQNYDFNRDETQIPELLKNTAGGELVDEKKLAKVALEISRLISGHKFYREQPFLYYREKEGSHIIVQGKIDLIIVYESGLEIIDYKSGQADRDKMAEYVRQLKIYAEAAEKLLGLKVISKKIISVETAQILEV